MAYQQINPIPQFNFQINRVLTYGAQATEPAEVAAALATVKTLDEWHAAWLALARAAEQEARWLHSAYYYRMAEFFLKSTHPQKTPLYEHCVRLFYQGFDQELHLSYQLHQIPFAGGTLKALVLPVSAPKTWVLVCGGYDSFIEEFVLQIQSLAQRGYAVILFEGPGQGQCLLDGLYFRPDFEAVTSAVIDYFQLEACAMVGISWGGYFALRSAAFEPRITAAAAYDAMDDGLEVMTNIFPAPISRLLRLCLRLGCSGAVNTLTSRIRRHSILADWALSQGEYITHTATAYDFYHSLAGHTLQGLEERLTQHILLLAGQRDHYIPLAQYQRLQSRLRHTASLTCRLFTTAEGGEQHCQIGNHLLAVHEILRWLDQLYAPQRD